MVYWLEHEEPAAAAPGAAPGVAPCPAGPALGSLLPATAAPAAAAFEAAGQTLVQAGAAAAAPTGSSGGTVPPLLALLAPGLPLAPLGRAGELVQKLQAAANGYLNGELRQWAAQHFPAGASGAASSERLPRLEQQVEALQAGMAALADAVRDQPAVRDVLEAAAGGGIVAGGAATNAPLPEHAAQQQPATPHVGVGRGGIADMQPGL